VALSDEQKAMLRLLASGEQGYGDIAALMGLSEEEVRAKVVGALAQLQAEGQPAPDIPPPIASGPKPAAEVTPPEPEPPAAEGPQAEPALADAAVPKEPVAPMPVAPASASETGPPPAAAASPPPSARPPAAGRTITLPSGRNAWLLGGAIVAAVAVIVVVILLVSGGGGSGGGSSTGSSTATTEANSANPASAATNKTTQAILRPVDGSSASGKATFGVGKLKHKKQLILEVSAEGLSPTKSGETYAISLAKSSRKVMPIGATAVKADGKIAAATYVPNQIAEYLAADVFDQIYISRANEKKLDAALSKAAKAGSTPSYIGETVLRGTVTGPIVGLAVREEEAKKAEEKGE
jgi:hypothetical protein